MNTRTERLKAFYGDAEKWSNPLTGYADDASLAFFEQCFRARRDGRVQDEYRHHDADGAALHIIDALRAEMRERERLLAFIKADEFEKDRDRIQARHWRVTSTCSRLLSRVRQMLDDGCVEVLPNSSARVKVHISPDNVPELFTLLRKLEETLNGVEP